MKITESNNRTTLNNSEMSLYSGGFLIPYLMTKVVEKAIIVADKIIDWLTTEHKK